MIINNFRRLDGVMIANSVALSIVDPSKKTPEHKLTKLRFFWDISPEGIPHAIFKNNIFNGSSIFWPLSGLTIVNNSPTQAESPCNIIILGSNVMHGKDITDSEILTINNLAGQSEILSFKVKNSAIALVFNPFSPPNLWEYMWSVFPQYISLTSDGQVYESIQWVVLATMGLNEFAYQNEFLYLVGVYTRNIVNGSINSHSQPFRRIALEPVKYNVIGKIIIADIVTSKLHRTEVIYDTGTPRNLQSQWKHMYDNNDSFRTSKIVTFPKNCFPLKSSVTEGTLLFDKSIGKWIFTSMLTFENSVHICFTTDESILGQWSCRHLTLNEEKWLDPTTYIYYAAKLHQELSNRKIRDDSVSNFVVSFIPNNRGGPRDLFETKYYSSYSPKFLTFNIKT